MPAAAMPATESPFLSLSARPAPDGDPPIHPSGRARLCRGPRSAGQRSWRRAPSASPQRDSRAWLGRTGGHWPVGAGSLPHGPAARTNSDAPRDGCSVTHGQAGERRGCALSVGGKAAQSSGGGGGGGECASSKPPTIRRPNWRVAARRVRATPAARMAALAAQAACALAQYCARKLALGQRQRRRRERARGTACPKFSPSFQFQQFARLLADSSGALAPAKLAARPPARRSGCAGRASLPLAHLCERAPAPAGRALALLSGGRGEGRARGRGRGRGGGRGAAAGVPTSLVVCLRAH